MPTATRTTREKIVRNFHVQREINRWLQWIVISGFLLLYKTVVLWNTHNLTKRDFGWWRRGVGWGLLKEDSHAYIKSELYRMCHVYKIQTNRQADRHDFAIWTIKWIKGVCSLLVIMVRFSHILYCHVYNLYNIQNIYVDNACVSIFGTKTTIFCNLEFFASSDCVCGEIIMVLSIGYS